MSKKEKKNKEKIKKDTKKRIKEIANAKDFWEKDYNIFNEINKYFKL